jgi:hypothetical protein
LRLLLAHIGSADARLVAESLEVIRHLIQRDPESHRTTVIRLAKHLDAATSPQARASIIWLVGEFAGVDTDKDIAADVLRILAKGFADEAEPAKLQIVLLAAKVYIHHLNANPPPEPRKEELQSSASLLEGFQEEGGFGDAHASEPAQHDPDKQQHPIEALYQYILLLARYDTSYDLRDRARVYKALLATPTSTQLATLLLLAPKPVPQTPSPSETRKGYVLGSASLVVGEEGGVGGLRGYEDLPPWVEEGREPDPSVRDEAVTGSQYDGESRGLTAGQRLDAANSSRVGGSEFASSPGRSPTGMGMGGPGVSSSGGKEKAKTLDDWLAEEEEETDEESDEDEEDEEDEESDEEESEEEYETESEDERDEGAALVK